MGAAGSVNEVDVKNMPQYTILGGALIIFEFFIAVVNLTSQIIGDKTI